jgi:hypothetical protein
MSYKTVFIVDTVRGERIQMAKFLSEEIITVMTFVSIHDCFKRPDLIACDLIVFAPRKVKNEIKHLFNIKKKCRQIPLIVTLNNDFPDIKLTELSENGFSSPYIASSNEKVREIMLGLLAPDGLPSRTEVPHPVPIPAEVQAALSPRPE